MGFWSDHGWALLCVLFGIGMVVLDVTVLRTSILDKFGYGGIGMGLGLKLPIPAK